MVYMTHLSYLDASGLQTFYSNVDMNERNILQRSQRTGLQSYLLLSI